MLNQPGMVEFTWRAVASLSVFTPRKGSTRYSTAALAVAEPVSTVTTKVLRVPGSVVPGTRVCSVTVVVSPGPMLWLAGSSTCQLLPRVGLWRTETRASTWEFPRFSTMKFARTVSPAFTARMAGALANRTLMPEVVSTWTGRSTRAETEGSSSDVKVTGSSWSPAEALSGVTSTRTWTVSPGRRLMRVRLASTLQAVVVEVENRRVSWAEPSFLRRSVKLPVSWVPSSGRPGASLVRFPSSPRNPATAFRWNATAVTFPSG